MESSSVSSASASGQSGLSAVILSFNSRRHIGHCVRSLAHAFSQLPGPNEIHVVENGSTDGSAQLLRDLEREFAPLLQVIYNERNLGTTVSRNQALRRVRGRHVLVMDSDAWVEASSLAALVRTLDEDPRCGIAVPRLEYPDGRFQLSTDVFPTLTRKVHRLLRLRELEARAEPPEQPCTVDYAISALWLFRRSLLDEVGLLDERIFYSPEDVDFCLRVWKAGYTVIYDPRVSAVHDAQELSRGAKLNGFATRHAKGLLYLFWKHRYCFGLGRLYRRLGIGGVNGRTADSRTESEGRAQPPSKVRPLTEKSPE